ncbi:hypothetical protein YSA_10013 [Pseudomonas putida ND6]|uniref:Uncharacterized protein n=1 Tax=Pseudomonas putida ND6 TaxID=231023 RepID=I3V388_PSEPU|nr:hypothetical protein YSA_10013 [Pseudomonas putida ND6]
MPHPLRIIASDPTGNQEAQPDVDAISYSARYRCLQILFTEATTPNPYAA